MTLCRLARLPRGVDRDVQRQVLGGIPKPAGFYEPE